MATVLIPTDFTTVSLKLAEDALRNANLNKCDLVLFHAFGMPDSPFDLLTKTQQNPACECMNEPFRQACKQLKDQYPARIGKINVRCMHGDTRAVFRNYVEANDIDLIYCPEDYVFVPVHKRSVNPLYLFKKCSVPVLKITRKKASVEEHAPVYRPMQLSTS